MEILVKATQFFLSLSILVVLHEMGHFFPAKWFKTKVEKFYLFFDPWFSLFKFKKGETEYGVGWLPFGGYVKIAGMIDESMDTEQMKQPPQEWEFRSKKTWQRLIIMVGGVVVNLVLGFALYIMVASIWGRDRIDPARLPYGIEVNPLLQEYGLEGGDIILEVEGKKALSLSEASEDIVLLGARNILVRKPNGGEKQITLAEDIDYQLMRSGNKIPFLPRRPCVIDSVSPEGTANIAGLRRGDSLIAINNKSALFYDQCRNILSENKGETVQIEVDRSGARVIVECDVDSSGYIGFINKRSTNLFKAVSVHDDYSLGEAIPAGFDMAKRKLAGYIFSMKHLFTSAGVKQIGGFQSIANIFPERWDWQSFWTLTAWLSLVLAFMNILPIPALDGGHVMFLIYEMVAGKPPGEKFLERAQMVGIVFLLTLMLYANGNDIYKLIIGQ